MSWHLIITFSCPNLVSANSTGSDLTVQMHSLALDFAKNISILFQSWLKYTLKHPYISMLSYLIISQVDNGSIYSALT